MTIPWGLGLLLGFVLEPVLEATLPRLLGVSQNTVFLGLLAFLYLIVLVVLWPGMGPGRTWMGLPKRVPLGEALPATVLWSFVGYVVAIPFCLGIALLMTRGITSGEPGLFLGMFTLWMPLWWAVPIGAILAWRRERQRQGT
ncbi:MAG TPA: hypothetical protein VMW27_00285 [Thermoanaerobaculia bacterium]|nr:hypothetical protein [Thermoanaerobaculia bacterium]